MLAISLAGGGGGGGGEVASKHLFQCPLQVELEADSIENVDPQHFLLVKVQSIGLDDSENLLLIQVHHVDSLPRNDLVSHNFFHHHFLFRHVQKTNNHLHYSLFHHDQETNDYFHSYHFVA